MVEPRSLWQPERREEFVTPKPESESEAMLELSVERRHVIDALEVYIDDLRHWLIDIRAPKPDLTAAALSKALGQYFQAPGPLRQVADTEQIMKLVQEHVVSLVTKPGNVGHQRRFDDVTTAEKFALEEVKYLRHGALGEYVMERTIEKTHYGQVYYSGGPAETNDIAENDHEERLGIDFWVEIPIAGADNLVLAVQMKTIPLAAEFTGRLAEGAPQEGAPYPRETVFLHPLTTEADIETLITVLVNERDFDFTNQPSAAARQKQVEQRQTDVRKSLTKLITVQKVNSNVIPVFAWLPSANGRRENGWYGREHAVIKRQLLQQVAADIKRIYQQRLLWLQRSAEYANVAAEPEEIYA
ncbi:MAG: hypothetical protein Q7S64_02470 [bacterium]|nr:hypothetical protein [bacterium]